MNKKKDLIEEMIKRKEEGNRLYEVTHSNYKLNGITGTNMKEIFKNVCVQLDELGLDLNRVVEIKITQSVVEIQEIELFLIKDKDKQIKVTKVI